MIKVEAIGDLALLIAGLVREGIKFECRKDDTTKLWIITFTGGF